MTKEEFLTKLYELKDLAISDDFLSRNLHIAVLNQVMETQQLQYWKLRVLHLN